MWNRTRFGLRHYVISTAELFLLLCWVCGCALGVLTGMNAGDIYASLMRGAVRCPVSIVGLVISVYLPFLLSAFAVYLGKSGLLYIVCFLKSWAFTLAAYGTVAAYGSAGWLVQFLLQFSDILLLWLLCWFCLRHIGKTTAPVNRDFRICTAAVAAVCSIDYCVISPFLVGLTQI